MKAKIIDENVMSYFYEQNGCLYWNIDNGPNATKGSLAGTLDKTIGYYHVQINGKNYKTHRILYQIYNNVILTENDFIDHHDRNKQNNSKENLRLGDNSDNQCNKKVQKNNLSTGIKNISKITNKSGYEYYHIRIRKNNKIVFNKCYGTDKFSEEDVIKIRDAELIKHHGDFMSKG